MSAANAPSGSDTVDGSSTTPTTESAPTSQAIETFTAGLTPLMEALKASLQAIPPISSSRHARVSPDELRVIPMMSALLRSQPTLAGWTADDIDQAMADADGCAALDRSLTGLLMFVRSTRRLRIESGWQMSYDALSAARRRAGQLAEIASVVQDVDAILAQGSRVEQAGNVAVVAQERSAKALERATKAKEKSDTAVARVQALRDAQAAKAGNTGSGG